MSAFGAHFPSTFIAWAVAEIQRAPYNTIYRLTRPAAQSPDITLGALSALKWSAAHAAELQLKMSKARIAQRGQAGTRQVGARMTRAAMNESPTGI